MPHDLSQDEVLRRRARSTGTLVALRDMGTGQGAEDGRWQTVCEDHGGCVHHPTRKIAEGWLSHPEDWCPVCQERRPKEQP